MLDMAEAQQVTACIENSAGMCLHSTVSEDACAMHAVVAPCQLRSVSWFQHTAFRRVLQLALRMGGIYHHKMLLLGR